LIDFAICWFSENDHAIDGCLEEVQTFLDFIIVPNDNLSTGMTSNHIC